MHEIPRGVFGAFISVMNLYGQDPCANDINDPVFDNCEDRGDCPAFRCLYNPVDTFVVSNRQLYQQ